MSKNPYKPSCDDYASMALNQLATARECVERLQGIAQELDSIRVTLQINAIEGKPLHAAGFVYDENKSVHNNMVEAFRAVYGYPKPQPKQQG